MWFSGTMTSRSDLVEKGYCAVGFSMGEAERAAYTSAAKAVIDLAQDDASIHDALTFTLVEFKGRMNPTLFTVSEALNSGDQKLWLHAGYLSRQRAAAAIPERNQPTELRALWEPLESVLQTVEHTTRATLAQLDANHLAEVIFHPDIAKRVVLIRTVKYLGSLSLESGAEPVAGHADQSVATLHWYETHGGWFHAAPYPQDLMTDTDSQERRLAVAEMRSQLTPIVNNHEAEAAFFLGVGAKKLPNALRSSVVELPGCYHAGFRPMAEQEVVSPFASSISATDRVSTITFMHPNTDVLCSPKYSLATVLECRPPYDLAS